MVEANPASDKPGDDAEDDDEATNRRASAGRPVLDARDSEQARQQRYDIMMAARGQGAAAVRPISLYEAQQERSHIMKRARDAVLSTTGDTGGADAADGPGGGNGDVDDVLANALALLQSAGAESSI